MPPSMPAADAATCRVIGLCALPPAVGVRTEIGAVPGLETAPVPVPPGQVLHRMRWSSGATPAAAHQARTTARETLIRWGLAAVAADVELLVAELASNAVRHTTGPFTVVLTQRVESLLLEVRDTSKTMPVLRAWGDESEHGRGLWLVTGIADMCGCWWSAGGKTVWCSLRLPVEVAGPTAEEPVRHRSESMTHAASQLDDGDRPAPGDLKHREEKLSQQVRKHLALLRGEVPK
ncbi:ATP-binding protein [Streptomyces sp. NPDC093707]|uniref:ATP-binding protein n=1 Tax=Streptomyces sp. NPDC093707 TaxID=3154984 RepID=UPI00344E99C2